MPGRHDLADDLHDSSFECLSLLPGFPDVEDPEDSGVVVEARGVDDQPFDRGRARALTGGGATMTELRGPRQRMPGAGSRLANSARAVVIAERAASAIRDFPQSQSASLRMIRARTRLKNGVSR